MPIATDWRLHRPIGGQGEGHSSAPSAVLYLGVGLCLAITLLAPADRTRADRQTKAAPTPARNDAGHARATFTSQSEAATPEPDNALGTDAVGPVLPARDPVAGLQAWFGTDGVSVFPAGGGWQMQLTTSRYGCSDAAVPVTHSPTSRATAPHRAEYRARAGAATFSEWFVRRPLGLEHGMTLDESPCPGGEIEIDVGMNGLTPELRRDERGVDLRDGTGVVRLHYTDLYAEDATHVALPSRMAVTPRGVVLRVDARGATFPVTVDPLTWAAPQKISAGGAFATFGAATAVSGTTMIVGAPGVNSEQGAAYVSTQQPSGTWSQPPTALTAADGMSTDEFGDSVAISGSVAVVGAPGANSSQGKAYVFALQANGTWTPQGAAFTDPDGAAFDNFGAAVGISSSGAILVGAPNSTATFMGLTMAGKVYVFTQQPAGGYANTQTLTAPDAFTNYAFGSSISVSESVALIGSPGGGGGKGAAYVFTGQPDGSWTPSATIVAPDGMDGDFFGASVGLSGGLAIVGAPSATVSGVGSQGKAYVFAQGGTGWTQEGADLLAHSTFFMFGFGTSVAISGTTAVVGAPGASIPSYAVQGAAYVFTQSGTAFTQPASLQLAASDGFVGDGFGDSVAIGASTVVVGAPSELFGGQTQGAAYVAPVLLSVGSACSTNAQCAGNDCVTGHCCSSACAGPCTTCTTGTCASITSADDPNGCTGTSTCSASGVCGLKNGQLASSAASCASGSVADGVCCASACSAACDVCSVAKGSPADGTCAPAPLGAVGNPACGAGVACNGAIASCPGASCSSDTGCVTGFYCGASGTCQPQKSVGASCSVAAGASGDCLQGECRECAGTASCVDGVCCTSSACPACQACSAELKAPGGANGTCAAVLQGSTPHGECSSTSTCNGAGACRLKNGQPSVTPGTCATGFAVDGVCCDHACTGACAVCSTAAGATTDGLCATAPEGMSCDAGLCNGSACSASDAGPQPDAANAPDAESQETGARDASADGAPNPAAADAASSPDAGGQGFAARDASTDDASRLGVLDSGGHDGAAAVEDGAVEPNDGAFEEDHGDSAAGEFPRTHPSCSCRAVGAETVTGQAWGGSALVVLLALGLRRGRDRRRNGADARRGVAALLALAVLFAVPRPANAQGSSDDQRAAARAAATEGYKAMGEQRWADAVDRFTRAESLVHAPAHLLYLGRALVHLGKYVAARETYLRLTREVLPPQAPAAAEHAKADGAKDLQALEPKMASLVITVRPASAPVVLTMDGVAVPAAMIGIAIPADPGQHALAAKAEGYQPAEQTTTVSAGAQGAVTFDLQRAPASPSLPAMVPATPAQSVHDEAEQGTSASRGSAPLRIGGYASLVLAGAALGAGIILALESHDKVTDGDTLCPAGICKAASSQAIDSLNRDATLFGELSTGAFILSGVATATGVTAIVLSHGARPSDPPTATLRVAPGRLDVTGTF